MKYINFIQLFYHFYKLNTCLLIFNIFDSKYFCLQLVINKLNIEII